MIHLRFARAAMVALTAIGMVWTTTAHAASYESGAISIYGNNGTNPQDPGNPTVPGQLGMGVGSGNVTVPGYSGPGIDTRGDVKVWVVSFNQYQGKTTWKFRLQNIAQFPAKKIWIGTTVWRFVPLHPEEGQEQVDGGDYIEEMAPNAMKEITLTCEKKPGHPPCTAAGVAVWVGDAYNSGDRDPSNNDARRSVPQ